MSDAVLVLGMHRSGASAVTGVLTMLGGDAPKTLAGAPDERGCFESESLRRFHDDLLASAGSRWDDWRAFNPGWFGSPAAPPFKARALELFEAEFDGSPLPVMKDPRVSRFARFWLDLMRESGRVPHVVMPVRSPLDVALSLRTRDGFPLTKGVLLWLRHCLDAEAATRAEARSVFPWRDFASGWRAVCERIAADTALSWPRLSDRSALEIDGFLSESRDRRETDPGALRANPEVHDWAVDAYEALIELGRNPLSNSALATLDRIRGLLDQSSALFGRLLIDTEVDVERLQGQAVALAGERDALAAERDETTRALAAEVERARSDTEGERAALSEAARSALAERDALVAERALLAARLEEVQRALDGVSPRADALAEERERLATELAALRADFSAREAASGRALADLATHRRDLELALGEAAADGAALAAGLESLRRERAEAEIERRSLLDALELAQQGGDALAGERDRLAAELDGTRRLSAETAEARDAEALRLGTRLADAEAALAHAAGKRTRRRLLPRLRRSRTARTLDRSGLFDSGWYAGTYPDVAASGLGPAEHYLEIGFALGYNPNPFFDTRFYLAENEDVRRSGLNPALHYLRHGWREGRDPSREFSTAGYLEANLDVRDGDINPLAHWLDKGRREGRPLIPRR